jgi:hypothetical protein
VLQRRLKTKQINNLARKNTAKYGRIRNPRATIRLLARRTVNRDSDLVVGQPKVAGLSEHGPGNFRIARHLGVRDGGDDSATPADLNEAAGAADAFACFATAVT